MAKETAEEKLLKMMQKGVPASPAKKPPLKFSFSISMLNRILWLGVIVCLVLLAREMQSGFSLINKEVDLGNDIGAPQSAAQAALPTSRKIAYYLDKVQARNIFRPYEGQAAGKPAAVAKDDLAKKLSRYKLVGIAWLDLPDTAAVVVEDTKDKATYFLKQGEQLEGVTVKTIYTDRAVFSYENEETIIKL